VSKKKLKRPASAALAPTDAAQADIMLARIGTLMRDRQGIAAALEERMTEAKQLAAAKAAPIDAEIDTLTRGLQLWAEANRAALTNGHAMKTIKLAAGDLLWRTRPPSVKLKNVEAVLAALRERQLVQFIRTTVEVDKVAMLRDPGRARSVPGVTIGSEGEEFVVEPLKEDLPTSATVAGGVA
jgi:phage host-nuclease inhibitor protein Gam